MIYGLEPFEPGIRADSRPWAGWVQLLCGFYHPENSALITSGTLNIGYSNVRLSKIGEFEYLHPQLFTINNRPDLNGTTITLITLDPRVSRIAISEATTKSDAEYLARGFRYGAWFK